jgi:hypothetical protein
MSPDNKGEEAPANRPAPTAGQSTPQHPEEANDPAHTEVKYRDRPSADGKHGDAEEEAVKSLPK